jgi:hypothetical protein
MYDMVTLLNLGKNILKKVNHYPYSKCQVCGHKIMLIDMKYGKPCKPYLLHNWQKKCHCGCTTPVMKGKEFNELINFSKEQRLKELALEEGV